ncbi:BRCT domain-containing protein [Polychytrium aggregatum]|uniref:BRCT domain-containing protein n=1 Tax=Polychytrium aggregatum TaxID=110093 RepID=UPI0022FDF19C|nr:BRCT domain-containing protein [Polychytrium aggregatum]KAI9208597.1 BRCT domain-containing protein [Polychytrium aggregatum]
MWARRRRVGHGDVGADRFLFLVVSRPEFVRQAGITHPCPRITFERQATDILSGVVAHIDGYLGEGVNDLELKRLIEANGGRITRGPSAATTTHLVCTNLATSKRATLGSRKRTSFKIVDPKWITDSVAAGHRLPERPYEIL